MVDMAKPPQDESPDALLTKQEVRRRLDLMSRNGLLELLIEQSRIKTYPFKKLTLIAARDLPALDAARLQWDNRPRLRRRPARRVTLAG